jgi:SAM-dependent methyltransferase
MVSRPHFANTKLVQRLDSRLKSSRLAPVWVAVRSISYHLFRERRVLVRNRAKTIRFLEIGPGSKRVDGFETLNLFRNGRTDYVADASKPLRFATGTFDGIYASHILEHVPWYIADRVLTEWIRVLKPGGFLEIWVPDALKIAKAFCAAEESGEKEYLEDGWSRFNEERDSARWFCGRMFSYGDGSGNMNHFNYHRGALSERYLRKLLADCGLRDVRKMTREECRGYDHGWINLGMVGVK